MQEHSRNKEERLIESIKLGDQKAFGELYDRYAPLLLGVIRKTFPNPQQSEEILKELFTQIWKKIASYDPARQSLYIWIYTLAKELIIKTKASYSIERSTIGEQTNVYPDNQGGGMGNSQILSEKILDLIYFKGYTYKEAAMVLKIPLERLKENIRTELNYLRETLVK